VTLISSETILISRTPSLYSQSTSRAMFSGERMRTKGFAARHTGSEQKVHLNGQPRLMTMQLCRFDLQ
jgi:hypothetical protein